MKIKNIPLSIPNFEGNERKYVDDAIELGWVSTGGSYINKLEREMSKFIQVDSVAACQSGTSALHLSLVDCNIVPGNMIIVPTLTFIAAVNPIKYQFAEPIFMDCDDSLCMDPVKLSEFCENECDFIDGKLVYKANKQHVRAIIVVHVFGNIANMEAIMEVAEKFNLTVIEDATEALGSYYTKGKFTGKYAGTIGNYGAYSFNGNKIITTGGGGAITARNKKDVEHMKYLSTQAKDDLHYYTHNEVGYNYRMTNIQAAIGVAQMEEIKSFIKRKNENYELYKKLFNNCKTVKLLEFREGTYSNKWFYSLKIDMDKIHINMHDIISKLQEHGIESRPIWGLIHEQIPYKNAISYKIEKASYFSKRILNIPCSTQITEKEINYVVGTIKQILGENI